jgi:menaquinone-dependent protoporphyrinogen oxidase
MEKILVAYATKYGSTQKIAEVIGEELRQAELRSDIVPVDRVRELTPYKAVILGSAVYIGKWRKEAVEFLKKNAQTLAERPVWLFSSGPTGEGDPVELVKGWRLPAELQPLVDQIKPRDIAVFHGNLNIEKMNFIEKGLIKNVKAPVGDFRDWEAITAWATSIADALR